MLLLVLVQMDGTARLLDPEFNLADALQSFGSELVWRRISPARLQREVTRLYRDLSRFIRVAPRETLGVLEQLRRVISTSTSTNTASRSRSTV
ncbi:MAG: hypothetical protein R2851_22045 [Caldilineaceae bacterium]